MAFIGQMNHEFLRDALNMATGLHATVAEQSLTAYNSWLVGLTVASVGMCLADCRLCFDP